MATSGSVNFNQTRNEIVQDALALIGVYGVGRSISAEDMNFTSNMFNKMVKTYQAQGLHLWAKEEGYLFVADNTGGYTLSSDSTSARATLRSDAVITELSAAEAVGQTTLSVDSSTGMATSDIVGVVADDDTVFWSTISSIPDSTSIVIADALTVASASGNNVYTFTSRVNKPLRILSMRHVTDGPDSPNANAMTALSHEEFFDIPNKEQNGTPNCYYYNPDLTTGNLYVWPRPSDPDTYFEFTFERMLEDFDASSDNPDFPSEWLECLTYNLAVRVAPAFGKSNMLQALLPMATELYRNVSEWDNEITNISFQPDLNR